jgi:hypothetical protein
LVNPGNCNLSLIDGCATYNWSQSLAAVNCLACKDTYYAFNATTCKKGKVPYCKTYTDAENKCTQCQDGYWLQVDVNSTVGSYCFPKDTMTGCKVAKFTIESDNSPGDAYSYLNMSCTSCDSPYGYIVATEDADIKTKCQQVSYTGNCQTVQQTFALNTTNYSFQCNRCSDAEYLSADDVNYVCKTRLKTDPESANCLTFQLSSENCAQCKD